MKKNIESRSFGKQKHIRTNMKNDTKYDNKHDSKYDNKNNNKHERIGSMNYMDSREEKESNLKENQIEGRNPVMEALESGRPIDKIFIAEGVKDHFSNRMYEHARNRGIVVQRVDRTVLDRMTATGSHQGIIALGAAKEYVGVDDILSIASERKEAPFVIILDGITDPHNTGSIIRTAEACGVHGVIIPKRRAAGLTPIVEKASAGALEHMAVAKVANIPQTIDILKDRGLWIAGAEMNGAVLYSKADMKGPIALVIGSEGEGIGRLTASRCDFLLKIPMLGRISSLNASAAAAVLMYEVSRQRNL